MESLSQVIMSLIALFVVATIIWSWLFFPVRNILMLRKENKQLKSNIEKLSASNVNDIERHLPNLIRLCHPDKHDNNAISNDVTKWLLSQR